MGFFGIGEVFSVGDRMEEVSFFFWSFFLEQHFGVFFGRNKRGGFGEMVLFFFVAKVGDG